MIIFPLFYSFFFFNDTATTEIYTLSLHDALPISFLREWSFEALETRRRHSLPLNDQEKYAFSTTHSRLRLVERLRSEEHTSELQSRLHLVCRLLLEKKKNNQHKLVPNTYAN